MLIKCAECELQVSDKAIYCPHCGYPQQSNAKLTRTRATNKRRRLPNGFGQISEIKNQNLRNPFRAMVTVGKTPTGRPICKPLKPESYFPTYNDAYAALVEYNRNPYDLAPSMTMKELYERWIEKYKTTATSSTAKGAEAAWAYCTSVYDMRVLDVRPRHIKGCMEMGVVIANGQKRKASAATQKRIKSIFNLMLDYALEYELVDKNYARNFTVSSDVMKAADTAKKQHIPFTEEEMNLLWSHVHGKRYADFIIIQCYSGWRPQELGLIKLEDVDFANWTFKGGMKTEAGESRVVPIHSRIRDIVHQKYDEAKKLNSPYIFNHLDTRHDRTFSKLTYHRYQYYFTRICDELKLNSEHRPHDGRKHFVTMAKKYGVDEYAIKYMVGHAITDITEKIYTKRELEWLQKEIEKIK